jgi:hypothetical protein
MKKLSLALILMSFVSSVYLRSLGDFDSNPEIYENKSEIDQFLQTIKSSSKERETTETNPSIKQNYSLFFSHF